MNSKQAGPDVISQVAKSSGFGEYRTVKQFSCYSGARGGNC